MELPLRVAPVAVERVWGGSRLRPGAPRPVGELWLAGPGIPVADGPFAGRNLDDVAGVLGPGFVGTAAPARTAPRFPLLVKLLDPAEWLSVQVHPDDATARRLAGPDAVGKAETWYVIEAAPGAELLVGARTGVAEDELRAAMRRGSAVTELLERHRVTAGDTILLPAGTLHAVGPGAFLYELQQPSDLTYRVDDWGRPPGTGRRLHPEESLASVDPASRPRPRHGATGRVATSPHFVLDVLAASTDLDPAGRTLQVVTAVGAPVELAGDGWAEHLAPLETVVVPATAGRYAVRPAGGARALVAALP